MNRALMDRQMFKMGGVAKSDFPDLSGDGKVTQKDILMGRGVISKQEGGMIPADPMMMPAEQPMMPPEAGAEAAVPAALEQVFGQMQMQMDGLDNAEDLESMMNAVRGDQQPIEARRAELAEYVGPDDAQQTPESVLALVQPVMQLASVDQGIGSLAAEEMMATPVEGPMAEGIMSTVNMAPEMPMEVGNQPPVNFRQGGAVQYFADANPQRVVMPESQMLGVPTTEAYLKEVQPLFQDLIPDRTSDDEYLKKQQDLSKSQMLFDIANTALRFATPGSRQMSPAERLAEAAQETQLLDKIGARSQNVLDVQRQIKKDQQQQDLTIGSAALQEAIRGREAMLGRQATLAAARQKTLADQAAANLKFQRDIYMKMLDDSLDKGDLVNLISPDGSPTQAVDLKSAEGYKLAMDLLDQGFTIGAKTPAQTITPTLSSAELRGLVVDQPLLDKFAQGNVGTGYNQMETALLGLLKGSVEVREDGRRIETPAQDFTEAQRAAIRARLALSKENRRIPISPILARAVTQTEPLPAAFTNQELNDLTIQNSTAVKNVDDQGATGGYLPDEITNNRLINMGDGLGPRVNPNRVKFNLSLLDETGYFDVNAPGFRKLPTKLFDQTAVEDLNLAYQEAQGLSGIDNRIALFFTEPLSELIDIGVSKKGKQLRQADIALKNLKLSGERFLTASRRQGEGRMLAQQFETLQENLEGLEPGVLNFDTTGLETLNGLIGLIGNELDVIKLSLPEYGGSVGFSKETINKDRKIMEQGVMLMAEMTQMRDHLDHYVRNNLGPSRENRDKIMGQFSRNIAQRNQ
jgi:hypothetical protein